MFATNDRAVSHFTITGTVTGSPYPDIPPTGQKVEYDGMDVWTVRDGRLHKHWDQFDTTRALVQLGVEGLPLVSVQAASQPVNR